MSLSSLFVRNNHHTDDAGFTAIDIFDSPASKYYFGQISFPSNGENGW